MDDAILQESADTGAGKRPVQEYHRVENCEIEVPQPAGIIIFGASGDLTKRKLFPSRSRFGTEAEPARPYLF